MIAVGRDIEKDAKSLADRCMQLGAKILLIKWSQKYWIKPEKSWNWNPLSDQNCVDSKQDKF